MGSGYIEKSNSSSCSNDENYMFDNVTKNKEKMYEYLKGFHTWTDQEKMALFLNSSKFITEGDVNIIAANYYLTTGRLEYDRKFLPSRYGNVITIITFYPIKLSNIPDTYADIKKNIANWAREHVFFDIS